jgi:predicted lipid-binding transport protein (Tim44 family)
MKETDWRNTLEVIVKGLVAVVVGLAGFYILGWVLSFLGGLLLGLAGIIVALLRWLVPVAIIVGVVYFAVTQLQPKPVVVSSAPAKPDDTSPAEAKAPEPEAASDNSSTTSDDTSPAAAEPDDTSRSRT